MIRVWVGLSFLFSLAAYGDKLIPEPPRYYVLDEPRVLEERTLHALQSILVEHDRTTGEQFLITIFNSLEGQDPVEFTNRVFKKWGIGQRGKDNGVLLALYWKEHKARIEVGYGLEPILTDAKSKILISDFLIPELKNGDPNRAITLTTVELLKIIESPLIASGKIQQILREGGFKGRWTPRPTPSVVPGWIVWLIVGLVIFVIVMNQLTSAEAHFTAGGWHRPSPWRKTRWTRGAGWLFGGGGFGGGGFMGGGGGGGFGGGGFMGGGGSSGGGGASGSW